MTGVFAFGFVLLWDLADVLQQRQVQSWYRASPELEGVESAVFSLGVLIGLSVDKDRSK